MTGQESFKYVYALGHINAVLEKIRNTGRPAKLTMPYLRDTGLLKNAQYSAVLDLLKGMGFLDSSGAPMRLYAEYQNPSRADQALSEGIRNAYPQLFRAYPEAHKLPRETLDGYIKQQTGAKKSVLDKISGTFRRLCSLVDYGAVEEPPIKTETEEEVPKRPPAPTETLIPITMNIQIVIPSDATAEQYDRIFSGLRKFLMK